MTNALGTLAGLLSIAAFLPQIFKMVRTRSAQDVSLLTFATFALSAALWIVYGLIIHAGPVIVTNSAFFILSLAVTAFKRRYRHWTP